MSTAEAQTLRTGKSLQRLTATARQAILAAVASGMTQNEVAQQFGVHRNTVSMICKDVRSLRHSANPLNGDWKSSVRTEAQRAVTEGLRYKRDPYKAATIGVKVLEGIGDFVSGSQVNIDNNLNVVFAWQAPQASTIMDVEAQPVVVEPVNTEHNTGQ